MTIPSFETIFAVPLSCEACIRDVSSSLHSLQGIHSVSADLDSQLVQVRGTAAPSAIVAAIQSTGRDAILRGSGVADSAAVCILETHAPSQTAAPVRGLVRIVQVAPSMTVMDLSLRGVQPGTYRATIRERGDISRGPESVGGVWEAVKAAVGGKRSGRGDLGTIEVGGDGVGSAFVDRPVQIWEMVGRSVVVARFKQQHREEDGEKLDRNDPDTLVGVVARSAGVWDNDKTVCSCSGKTVWEERKEQADRGML